jgi:hypothetical protein
LIIDSHGFVLSNPRLREPLGSEPGATVVDAELRPARSRAGRLIL